MTEIIERTPAMTLRLPDEEQPPSVGQEELIGIQAEEIARICKVDVVTARRWKAGKNRIPHTSLAVLAGDLGVFGESWKGWRIQGDVIISPEGLKVRRDDALAVPFMVGQVAAMQAELRKSRYVERVHGPIAKQLQLTMRLQGLCQELLSSQQALMQGSEADTVRLTHETAAKLAQAAAEIVRQAENPPVLPTPSSMQVVVSYQAET